MKRQMQTTKFTMGNAWFLNSYFSSTGSPREERLVWLYPVCSDKYITFMVWDVVRIVPQSVISETTDLWRKHKTTSETVTVCLIVRP